MKGNAIDSRFSICRMPKIQRKYKTLVQRVAAMIIDGIIFLPVTFFFASWADPNSSSSFVYWTFLAQCAWLIYSVVMHGKYGQTLGKMASTIKVFSVDEKTVIGYRRAFLREIITVIIVAAGLFYTLIYPFNPEPEILYENFTFYPSLISFLLEIGSMLFSAKRRALHDLVAGSVVLDITKYRKWDFEYEKQAGQTPE